MLRKLCVRVYIAIYTYMQDICAYMEPEKHIYRSYIYIFAMFICLYLWIVDVAYVQMGANWCKCMLHCTSAAVSIAL